MASLPSAAPVDRRQRGRTDVAVVLVALLVDVACVVVFTAVGRVSHGEDLAVGGLARTAWPFLAGCVLGSLFAVVRGRPTSLRSGVVVWLDTVLLGMLLRALTDAGTQLSFVIVTLVVLGVLMVGWRAGRRLVGRRRTGRPADASATRPDHGRSARLS